MTEKTSPYIFPFTPFVHLDVAAPTAQFEGWTHWSVERLKSLLERFAPRIELADEAASIASRIVDLFTHPQVLFGKREFVESRRDEWIEKLAVLIDSERRIDFTILGYPFKMPVSLKTDRTCADFGELVSLCRLSRISEAVSKIYSPGAMVHVFTEGPFGAFNGVDRGVADAYVASLNHLIEVFELGNGVTIHDLNAAIDDTPQFDTVWKEVTEELRAKRDAGDPLVLQALKDALPVRFHNLANPGVSSDELRRAYLDDGSADDLRRSIHDRATEGVLFYRGFLDARDRINLLEKYVPDGVAMTVSPRAGRLGVRPLPAPAAILPYHGVPVLSEKETKLRIEYLWDVKCSGKSFERIFFDRDLEDKPFLYVEVLG